MGKSTSTRITQVRPGGHPHWVVTEVPRDEAIAELIQHLECWNTGTEHECDGAERCGIIRDKPDWSGSSDDVDPLDTYDGA